MVRSDPPPRLGNEVKTKKSRYHLKGILRKCRVYRERKDSSLYDPVSKLDFLLIYLKENPNQSHHGLLFEMSQSKVSEWISFLLPVLEESLHKMKIMPQTGSDFVLRQPESTDFLVIDVVERIVPRMTDNKAQKEEYSGKRKAHTMKNLAVTDQNKGISQSRVGVEHAFAGVKTFKIVRNKIRLKGVGCQTSSDDDCCCSL